MGPHPVIMQTLRDDRRRMVDAALQRRQLLDQLEAPPIPHLDGRPSLVARIVACLARAPRRWMRIVAETAPRGRRLDHSSSHAERS